MDGRRVEKGLIRIRYYLPVSDSKNQKVTIYYLQRGRRPSETLEDKILRLPFSLCYFYRLYVNRPCSRNLSREV